MFIGRAAGRENVGRTRWAPSRNCCWTARGLPPVPPLPSSRRGVEAFVGKGIGVPGLVRTICGEDRDVTLPVQVCVPQLGCADLCAGPWGREERRVSACHSLSGRGWAELTRTREVLKGGCGERLLIAGSESLRAQCQRRETRGKRTVPTQGQEGSSEERRTTASPGTSFSFYS